MEKLNSIKQIYLFSIALAILLGYQYTGATWSPPPSSPPSNNLESPINVGTSPQSKLGNLGAIELIASDYVKAGLQMWSPEYCDENGINCIDPENTVVLSGNCGVENILYRNGSGQWVCTGSVENMLPNCADGQILKKISGSWQCSNP